MKCIPLALALFAVVFSLANAIWATCAARRLERRSSRGSRRCPYCYGAHERTSR